MNIRRITDHYDSTLETLEKIYKDYDFEPVSSQLSSLGESIKARKPLDKDLEFISAFENGGEIGVLATKNNEICALSIKKYAQKRGVGKALIDAYLETVGPGKRVYVQIEPDFVPFYEDLGFKVLDENLKQYDGIGYLTMFYQN